MLNDQYLVMNPTRNNILPTYLGNYGLSYVGNDNIPNPWTMIPNPYYPRNFPLTFSNTPRLVAYPFLNMVSTGNVAIGGSKYVQVSVMTPPIATPIGKFSTQNSVAYFQLPTPNPAKGLVILEVGY
jgi:hypothetical protein